MKRLRSTAIGAVTLAGMALLTVERPYAGEFDHPTKCTLKTLNGQYLVAANGTLFPPAFGVTEQSVSAAAGYSTYNGDGTGTDWVAFTIDGTVAVGAVPTPTPTTYTLKSDCTGTKTVMDGPHFNIFVAIDGSGLTAIATDQGFAVSESDRRVGPSNQ
jgi:hypothetical protein